MTNKIKPKFIAWYEADFQAEPLVRHMKPMARHFYRALLIQASYCSTRPYLPDDDNQLWILADAESEEQWKEHSRSVRAMFSPIETEGVKLLQQKRLLVEWEKMEAMYSGKGKKPGPTHPVPTPPLPGGTDKRPEQTRPDRTEQQPYNRTEDTTSPHLNQRPDHRTERGAEGAGSGLGSGDGDGVRTKHPIGTGKPLTGKMPRLDEEEDGVTPGTKAEDLVVRYWLIAKKKPNDGQHCGAVQPTDRDQMHEIVNLHGVEKVGMALDHIQRSDYWGCDTAGKLDGIRGFGKALEAIYAQARRYLEKVKETARAARS